MLVLVRVPQEEGCKTGKTEDRALPLHIGFVLRRVLGAGAVASLLEMGERDAVKKYYRFLTEYSSEMSEDEREKLKNVILDELEHEKFFREEEKAFHTENIRDLVLGMNDGLVEILGAVTGLSAVYPNRPELVGISG